MKVYKVSEENFESAYGILCNRVYPQQDVPQLPFGSTWCLIDPSQATKPHMHHEGESFFILKGQGLMDINGERRSVDQGDVVHIPAYSSHQLTNLSPTERLEFISMWWAQPSLLEETFPQTAFVTAAPPTPNGDLHLGHLSGPYVAADAYTRYLKMRGVKTIFVSGSDDNQSYVPFKGQKLGLTSEAVVERFASANELTLRNMGVQADYFLRPGKDPEYVKFVQDFFKKLFDGKKLAVKDAPSLFCAACDLYLYEAHVRGKCPGCRAGTNGNGCEACGMTNDCADLIDPICNHCDARAQIQTTKRIYFPLGEYKEKLRGYYKAAHFNSRLRALTEELLHKGLPDITISHIASWGIPVPVKGFESQVIYEWFEMAAGYLYMAQKLSSGKSSSEIWNSKSSQVIQFFGFDNNFFYSSFIPAILMAHDENIQLPRALITNEFYKLEGEKFSTSRQHAIWGDEILKFVPADILRFYLAHDRPEAEETNFCLQDFKKTVQEVFVDRLEGLLHAVDETLTLDFGRLAPRVELHFKNHALFHQKLVELTADTARSFSSESFSLQRVARNLNQLLSLTFKFHRSQSFLKHIPSLRAEWESSVALELLSLKTFGLLAAPVMPATSAKILKALRHGDLQWDPTVTPIPEKTEVKRLNTDFFSKGLRQIERFEQSRKS